MSLLSICLERSVYLRLIEIYYYYYLACYLFTASLSFKSKIVQKLNLPQLNRLL